MRKFITLALIAATAIPAAANAQSRGELRRDRQDIREEQRDLNQARRSGDRGDVRDARGDLREARQEYREDRGDRNRNWGRNDWRGYRDRNRNLYARGNWRAPFRYQTFRAGGRIAPNYYGRSYWINDPWRYRLPRARPNQRWIRHYNDVVLIDYRRGIVIDTYRGFYR
jgi:Ni/Co efflux regulator RcnB